jgi:signal transduction histidine kinase
MFGYPIPVMTNLYSALSKLRFLKRNYSLKFLFIAFIGIHIPLISIVIISITDIFSFNQTYILPATLIATLAATTLTLFLLNKLLWPLKQSKMALENYVGTREIPNLPIHFEDEAGVLMKELQRTIEHLDYLIDEKKDVITLLSHDIRTPFSQTLALSSLISQETEPKAMILHALTIKEISIKNLLVLNDILKLLKTDHIDESADSAVELNELLNDIIQTLSPSAFLKSITLNCQSARPLYVIANRVLLAEAISNLLNNAIKFSYPGSEIRIGLEERKGYVSISIKDNGMGISETDKTKIFKRFTSAGKTGTAGEHSSGVGLYLSKKIITKHKGHLSVTSEGKDKGSVFTVTLPLH